MLIGDLNSGIGGGGGGVNAVNGGLISAGGASDTITGTGTGTGGVNTGTAVSFLLLENPARRLKES